MAKWLEPGWRYRVIISGNPTGHGPKLWQKSTDFSAAYAIFFFRLLPPAPLSPGSFRYGPHLARVDDGNISGGQDDDFGGEYLANQQASGRICGGNRPILARIMPFSASVSFRLLPSASDISRQRPFRAASGPFG